MIACVEDLKERRLHIVQWVGRSGIRALAKCYDGTEHNAGDGTVQVPDGVFTRGQAWPSMKNGLTLAPCYECKIAAGFDER